MNEESQGKGNYMQRLPAQEKRVETGVVQFGEDWPGVFIRGDNAGYYAMALKDILARTPLDFFDKTALKGLQQLLAEAVVGPAREVVQPDQALASMAKAAIPQIKVNE